MIQKFNKVGTLLLAVGISISSAFAGGGDNPKTTDLAISTFQDDLFPEIIKAIPSPVELSELIKSLNTEYPAKDLRDPSKIQDYTSQYKQALNLGVYSTDLGFASLFKKNTYAFNYLNGVKDISNQLSIGQFFDNSAIEESRKAIDNGTMTEFATKKIDDITDYLVDKNRQHVCMLMLTGGWVEAVHISIKVYNKTKSVKLKEKIGDQKVVMEKLMLIWDLYSKPEHAALKSSLTKLKAAFDKVTIETVKGEVKEEVVNGQLVISGGDTSKIVITDSNIAEIEQIISSIRASIVE